MKSETIKKFLTNTDETGRHIVYSIRTGKKYFVEPITKSKRPADWGDIDPATKKVSGSYGKKYTGAVTEEESLITTENGFEKIHYTDDYDSPYTLIDKLDSKYPDKQ